MQFLPIHNAILSVSDKLGLIDFAKGLSQAGVRLYSTGGTAAHIREGGVEVQEISDYTGFPEMMDGRVKTLHPKIFAGILRRDDRQDDVQALSDHQIDAFQLVVVNLYPFEATIARDDVSLAEAVEQIDIGGPSLVRAAAKNHRYTTIVTSPEQYAEVLEQIANHEGVELKLRQRLAAAAFCRTAAYDQAISGYLEQQWGGSRDRFPEHWTVPLRRRATLRYGENPHQQAALYTDSSPAGPNLISAHQLNGKELSYNNLLDLDTALTIARSLPDIAVSVIKHNNPCGAASANELSIATQRALDGDPVSAFGSILGMNREVDEATAEVLAQPGLFIEAIVAPGYSAAALEILKSKPKWRQNVRLMEVGEIDKPPPKTHYRFIEGGMLLQDADVASDQSTEWTLVTKTTIASDLQDELAFAWAMVRHVKSNAIAVTRQRTLCGAGAGQMSRVDSVELALKKAGERSAGGVLASDAFFPFPDSIHRASEAGIAAIIQPGGSKRDEEVIEACDEHGLAMIFTGRRHFKH